MLSDVGWGVAVGVGDGMGVESLFEMGRAVQLAMAKTKNIMPTRYCFIEIGPLRMKDLINPVSPFV